MLPMAALSLPPVGVYCSGGGATPNSSISNNNLLGNHALDAAHIQRAAELADGSAGFTSPHPNFGCVIASKSGKVAGEGFLYAQGTKPAEVLAVDAAGDFSRRATAYLNMEPGDCHGDHSAVSALVQAGIERVVIGLRHPLQHLRGNAIRALRSQGLQVDVLGEDLNSKLIEEARKSCLLVNAPLICRAASRVPFSVLKYAMTLDGKIAASSGHAAWISSKTSRNRVFELRGRSDAVIVGGNTVRKDNPRLTARHGGGHMPMRIVMSQTLDLPEEAHLWDTSDVSTIVATQRGARRHFQKHLASKGIEVVEFDILNPREVMEYFHDRGYLSLLWECGGTLAAAAISSGVIHKVRCEWESVKIEVMYGALKCKFSIYPHLNAMLLSSAGCVLVEASPHDLFWGGGRDGEGLNYLGRLLMQLRSEFLVRLQLTDDIDIVCACTDSL